MFRCLTIVIAARMFVSDVVLSDEAPMLSISEFQELTPADRHEFLVGVFESRLRACSNLMYETETVRRNQRRQGDVFGEVVEPDYRDTYRRFRDGDSYRMVRHGFGRKTTAGSRTESGYDAREGVSRAKQLTDAGVYGRIDTEHESIITNDQYCYWLTGPQLQDWEFLFPYYLSQREAWETDISDVGHVKLTAPWRPYFRRERICGEYVIWLDPEKGYMPVRGKARWDMPEKSWWRTEEFTVEDAQQFDSLWMPMKLIDITHTSTNELYKPHLKDVVSIAETTVHRLEFGTVTAEDLEVVFPPGTEVVDAIRGVTYQVGSAGEEVAAEPLFVGERPVTEVAPAAVSVGQGKYKVMGINLGLAVIALAYLIHRRVRTRHARR